MVVPRFGIDLVDLVSIQVEVQPTNQFDLLFPTPQSRHADCLVCPTSDMIGRGLTEYQVGLLVNTMASISGGPSQTFKVLEQAMETSYIQCIKGDPSQPHCQCSRYRCARDPDGWNATCVADPDGPFDAAASCTQHCSIVPDEWQGHYSWERVHWNDVLLLHCIKTHSSYDVQLSSSTMTVRPKLSPIPKKYTVVQFSNSTITLDDGTCLTYKPDDGSNLITTQVISISGDHTTISCPPTVLPEGCSYNSATSTLTTVSHDPMTRTTSWGNPQSPDREDAPLFPE